jgi:hypothetical protein
VSLDVNEVFEDSRVLVWTLSLVLELFAFGVYGTDGEEWTSSRVGHFGGIMDSVRILNQLELRPAPRS